MTRNGSSPRLSRRRLLGAFAALPCTHPVLAQAPHGPAGFVDPPRALPRLRVVSTERGPVELADLLRGRITAVQLMFTGCSATCPLQGAVFAEAQRLLQRGTQDSLRLLSVSIDPLGDDATTLRAWLKRFGAVEPRWQGAVVSAQQLDALLDFFGARAAGPDRHTPQVHLIDRQARLVFRSTELAPPEAFIGLMQRMAASG
jgi:protein SCO1/2